MSATRGQCDARPTVCLTSRRASPPIGWYQIILLGERGTCVLTTCPGLHSGAAGIRTRNPLIASLAPYRYSIEPHNTAWIYKNGRNTVSCARTQIKLLASQSDAWYQDQVQTRCCRCARLGSASTMSPTVHTVNAHTHNPQSPVNSQNR